MAKAQDALRGREWGEPMAPFVALLRDRIWQRQLQLISLAYTCLPLERAAAMLGSSLDDVEQGAFDKDICPRTWNCSSPEENLVIFGHGSILS